MAEQQQSDTPEAPIEDDVLWAKAQKDRASTQADDAGPSAEAKEGAHSVDGMTDDPLAGLPEPTRKLIEQIQAKTVEQDESLKTVGQKLATAHGTIGNLRKQLDDSLATLRQMQPTVEAVKAQEKEKADTAKAEMAKKKAEVRERLSDLPDVLEYLDMVAPADEKPAVEQKPEQIPEQKPEPAREAPSQDEVTVIKLQNALHQKVPGWVQKRDSKEFQEWLPTQSEEIKRRAESWDVDEAASVFQSFDKHMNDAAKVARLDADRQARLRRGETVQGSGTAQTGTDASPDSLWEKAKRDRAKARSGV